MIPAALIDKGVRQSQLPNHHFRFYIAASSQLSNHIDNKNGDARKAVCDSFSGITKK
jgi:hypothetical protein